MNWQMVIALILLTPLAALVVTSWVKWTLSAWRTRTSHTPLNLIGTGREHWILWLVFHGAAMALVGTCLLLPALEGQQR